MWRLMGGRTPRYVVARHRHFAPEAWGIDGKLLTSRHFRRRLAASVGACYAAGPLLIMPQASRKITLVGPQLSEGDEVQGFRMIIQRRHTEKRK